MRHKQRVVDAGSLLKEGEGQSLDDFFDDRGHWLQDAKPAAWHCPEASLEQQQFWLVLEVCLDGMPAAQGRVFMMREVLEMSTEEICKELGIKPTNLWVILHRARLSLRECIEIKWGAAGA